MGDRNTGRWTGAVAGLVGGILIMASCASTASAADSWHAVSKDALTLALDADKGTVDPFPYSYTGAAIVNNYGWTPTAVHYLDAVLSAQHSDGGWGNPFGDTSISHAVTTTQHVGPFLLKGYRAGRVPLKTVTRALDYVYRLPRDKTRPGWCLAPNPQAEGMCIHNISAGAALFVKQAQEAGIDYRPGMANELMTQVTKREVHEYSTTERSWKYRDDLPQWNDQDHNALCTEAMLSLAPVIGTHALAWSLRGAYDETAPLAHVHLNHFNRTAGAKWLGEVRAYMSVALPKGQPGQNIAMWRMAELAYWGSL